MPPQEPAVRGTRRGDSASHCLRHLPLWALPRSRGSLAIPGRAGGGTGPHGEDRAFKRTFSWRWGGSRAVPAWVLAKGAIVSIPSRTSSPWCLSSVCQPGPCLHGRLSSNGGPTLSKHRGRSIMKRNGTSSFIFVILLSLPVVGFASLDYDHFDYPRWKIFTDGFGPRIIEMNQRLEMVLPASSMQSSSGGFSGNLVSVCKLRGDFDIRVGYTLLEFPAFNGVRVGLVVQEGDGVSVAAVERTSFSQHDTLAPGEVYLTDFRGVARVSTTDSSGRLRLTREGNSLTGYYLTNINEWKSISSATYTASDVEFSIAAWSDDAAFDDQAVRVAFDNVRMQRGVLIGGCNLNP
jgi:hypothetical protein